MQRSGGDYFDYRILSAEARKEAGRGRGKMRVLAQLLGSLVTALVALMNEEEEVFP